MSTRRGGAPPRASGKGCEIAPAKIIWDARLLVRSGRCALCSSGEAVQVGGRQDGLALFECRECALCFVDPRPSTQQLQDYYDVGYFSGNKDFFSGENYLEVRDRAIADGSVTGYREITSQLVLSGKNILEIGCGSGALLQALKPHGPAGMVGIDLAPYPIDYGRKRYSLDLRCCRLGEASFEKGTFDLVVMIDLVEHVENLPSFLREIGRVLRPGGEVFLLTPNYNAYTVARSFWPCLYKDFEHLQYFSPTSLHRAANEMGLALERWWTQGEPLKLSPYPCQLPQGLHRFRYPAVSFSNLAKKLLFRIRAFGRPDSNYDLCALLKKKV